MEVLSCPTSSFGLMSSDILFQLAVDLFWLCCWPTQAILFDVFQLAIDLFRAYSYWLISVMLLIVIAEIHGILLKHVNSTIQLWTYIYVCVCMCVCVHHICLSCFVSIPYLNMFYSLMFWTIVMPCHFIFLVFIHIFTFTNFDYVSY